MLVAIPGVVMGAKYGLYGGICGNCIGYGFSAGCTGCICCIGCVGCAVANSAALGIWVWLFALGVLVMLAVMIGCATDAVTWVLASACDVVAPPVVSFGGAVVCGAVVAGAAVVVGTAVGAVVTIGATVSSVAAVVAGMAVVVGAVVTTGADEPAV